MARATRKKRPKPRRTLTRERILRQAIGLADESGLEGLSMRALGDSLGAGTMSLYNHVADKRALLDGIAELLAREVHVPVVGGDWRASMRQRAVSARDLFVRHPWAARLFESRTEFGPAWLGLLDATIGCLRRAGFSVVASYRALLLMDSYIYGFALQETSWQADGATPAETAAAFEGQATAAYPHFGEVIAHFMSGAGDSTAGLPREFELGLERVLDAVAALGEVAG